MKGLIKPSTRAWLREARAKEGFSTFDMLHGYVYARWSDHYIALAMRRHPLSKFLEPLINWIGGLMVKLPKAGGRPVKFEDTYHGKVVPLAAARQLVSVKENINLGELEKIIPYAMAREIVFKNPDHIAALDCPCRLSSPHPCYPLDVCIVVGEPFVSLVLEHQPDHAHRITQEQAAEIIAAEDRRGHVHHAFFKDATLGRFYAICNCCPCCCSALQVAREGGAPLLASSGYVAVVDQAACIGCGRCETACLFGAIKVVDGTAQAQRDVCMGCGICVNHCPQEAVRLERAPERGVPLEVEELIAQAHLAAVG